MERHCGQVAGYHEADAAATAEQKHAEVGRRYAWAEHEARKRHCSPNMLMAINRAREIRRWFDHRYGDSLPDDKAGRVGVALLFNYIVQVNRSDPIGAAAREARAWASWLSDAGARRMAELAIKYPIKLKADTIAERLGVTNELRVALRFTTIGACDLTRAERNKATRRRRTEADRERQRRNGVLPREQYRAKAEALQAEAAVLGISYEALRKRKRRAAKKACPKSLASVRASTLASHLGHHTKPHLSRASRKLVGSVLRHLAPDPLDALVAPSGPPPWACPTNPLPDLALAPGAAARSAPPRPRPRAAASIAARSAMTRRIAPTWCDTCGAGAKRTASIGPPISASATRLCPATSSGLSRRATARSTTRRCGSLTTAGARSTATTFASMPGPITANAKGSPLLDAWHICHHILAHISLHIQETERCSPKTWFRQKIAFA